MVVLAWLTGALTAPLTGFHPAVVTEPAYGRPIVWRAFETGKPADAVRVGVETAGQPDYGPDPPADHWAVRHPAWTPTLLNAVGKPPDLTLDPGIVGICDIYLGLRAVTPKMSLGIRLSSEEEFTVITAPAATPTHHYDFEFHWKWRVPMDGESVVVRALGQPLYLQYLKFVPWEARERTVRVPDQRIKVLADPERHFAFPGVAELANGDLVVVCREGDAHVCPRGRIVMVRSTDGGETWSERQVLFDSPSDERDPAVIALPDGTVVVSYNCWDSWRSSPALRAQYPAETARMEADGWGRYSGSFLIVSTDLGQTWSAPRRAPHFSPHGPVLGPDGALYWVGLQPVEGGVVVVIDRSSDLGESWQPFAFVASSPGFDRDRETEVWDEPNLIFLPEGRAIVTLRVEKDGYVWQSYSQDGGQTWSWPRRLPVWGYPQQLCRLSDGRLLMAYGYRREPYGIRACLSADGGWTWELDSEIAFRVDSDSVDLGYPYSIELRDGRVITVYYNHLEGTNCYLEAVCYRP